MTNIVQALKDAGYKYHRQTDKEFADGLYQKCVCENGVKLFYLNAYHYPEYDAFGVYLPESLCWDIQFNLFDGKFFNVEFSSTNIKDTEEFFIKMFKSMDCLAYEENY